MPEDGEKKTPPVLRRTQFDFYEEAYRELEQLQKELHLPSKSATVRCGLAVLCWLAKELQAGHKILVENDEEGTLKEISFPFLESKISGVEIAPDQDKKKGS